MVAAIAMLAISGALAVAYVPETLVERLASTRESVQGLSFGGRFKLWTAGIHAFGQRPLMGYGTAAFRNAVYPELGALTQVAHNSFISILVEEGLVGLLLYLFMFVAAFLAILRLAGVERRFGLILLATLFVAMLPLTWEDQKPVWFILGALVGLSNAQVTRSSSAVRGPAAPQPAPIGSPSVAARASHRAPSAGRDFGRNVSA
jgi:O-antigen ligase